MDVRWIGLIGVIFLILLAGCIGEEKKEDALEKLREAQGAIKDAVEGSFNDTGAENNTPPAENSGENLQNASANTSRETSYVEWVKERYVKLDQVLHFDDLGLTIVVDGWDVGRNSSSLVLKFKNEGDEPISFEVVKAEAQLFNFTVEGEGKAFSVDAGEEKEVAVAFPANGNYVESVFLNISYRKQIEEKKAIEGYIRLKIELGKVMLERPTVYIYIPKQCEEEPWEGDPVSYYRSKGVEIYKAEKVFLSDVVCMACHVCPKGYMWRVYVEDGGEALEEDGWQRE